MPDYEPSQNLWHMAHNSIDMADHLYQLHDLAAEAHSIVEFGIRSGVSTWAMLDGLPEDGTYLGIDIDPAIMGWISERVRDDPRVQIIIADDREVTLPLHADLVMIDSSHEYEHTLQELDMAMAMRPNVIALHDYYYDQDQCKVREAVDEWVRTRPYRLDRIYPSRWGLAIVVPR